MELPGVDYTIRCGYTCIVFVQKRYSLYDEHPTPHRGKIPSMFIIEFDRNLCFLQIIPKIGISANLVDKLYLKKYLFCGFLYRLL